VVKPLRQNQKLKLIATRAYDGDTQENIEHVQKNMALNTSQVSSEHTYLIAILTGATYARRCAALVRRGVTTH
jgi:hypothetical protein